MNEGWIKLHRKILENNILKDQTACIIFIWLLLKVDRKTGKKTVGRFWASEELGIKPTTFYQGLKRLEKKWKVLTQKTNNKFTEISLVNWYKYQSNDNANDNAMTTNRQQNDTLQEVKNKELRNKEEEKIPNRLILSKGMKIAYAKEFKGITTIEIEEQRLKCNAYMNMSSSTYKNPGLFFRGWLERYLREKNIKISKQNLQNNIVKNLPNISEEERQRNLIKLSEMKKSLQLGVNR
jgi:hypothetical protein